MASQQHEEEPKTDSISELATNFGTDVDGFSVSDLPLYKYIHEGILKAQALSPSELNFSPSDTILCSLPKSGTTWLKALAFAISTRGRAGPETHPLLSSNPHDLIPFLEYEIAQGKKPRDPELTPLVSTHIPYKMLPNSVLDSGCKIVFICRNPKDVLVSFYHFITKLLDADPLPIENFELVFHLFCAGATSPYGSYWDHVLGFWEASLDHPERVLFLKYEDMMSQGSAHVRRLAEFMGCPFSEQEESEGVPAKIGEMCSFGSLSKLEVNKSHETNINREDGIGACNSSYFRKAEVGDWTNYLTEEMSNQLDHITMQKLGPGLNVM